MHPRRLATRPRWRGLPRAASLAHAPDAAGSRPQRKAGRDRLLRQHECGTWDMLQSALLGFEGWLSCARMLLFPETFSLKVQGHYLGPWILRVIHPPVHYTFFRTPSKTPVFTSHAIEFLQMRGRCSVRNTHNRKQSLAFLQR